MPLSDQAGSSGPHDYPPAGDLDLWRRDSIVVWKRFRRRFQRREQKGENFRETESEERERNEGFGDPPQYSPERITKGKW